MKKTYTKPELYYENFSLLGSIAASCTDVDKNAQDANACSVMDDVLGMTIFTTVGICELTGDGKICSAGTSTEAFGVVSGS